MSPSLVRICALIIIIGGFIAAYRIWWKTGDNTLVVYCAHDSHYADIVLAEFRKRTGIAVTVRYDSEATKSLGLVERLIAEGEQGPCDVFWNNEQLGTLALEKRGLLASYQGSGWQRIPAAWRQQDGYWSAFAARMRVIIVNTNRMSATSAAIRERLAGDLSRVAIAKPLYGTTLTHYSTLWLMVGGEKLQNWHHDMRKRGIREVDGNGMVKTLVAQGNCDFGFTDTDDYFMAVDAGAPVAMVPARLADNLPQAQESTILIPNTVSILRGAPHRAEAEQLVDFLLSVEGELLLARSPSRQIPLGPVDHDQLPVAVQALRAAALEGHTAIDLHNLSLAREQCLLWLKQEYAP